MSKAAGYARVWAVESRDDGRIVSIYGYARVWAVESKLLSYCLQDVGYARVWAVESIASKALLK